MLCVCHDKSHAEQGDVISCWQRRGDDDVCAHAQPVRGARGCVSGRPVCVCACTRHSCGRVPSQSKPPAKT
jgi:hypothetical protein